MLKAERHRRQTPAPKRKPAPPGLADASGPPSGQNRVRPPYTAGMVRTLVLALASLAAVSASASEFSAVVSGSLPKVVKIFGAGGLKNLESHSTGILVSAEGHIATVWNHVLDTDRVTVVLDDGRRFEAELVGAEPQADVAVLKIDAEGLPHFDLSDPGRAGVAARVVAFSNMYKVATGGEPVSVQAGVVAATTELNARRGRWPVPYEGRVYVLDAITNTSGSGGGAVVALDGRLLGMIGREVKGRDSNVWLNYAVPAADIRGPVERIISGRPADSGDEAEADPSGPAGDPRRLGLVLVPDVVPRTPGYVDDLVPGGEAERAGLRPDDLVVSLDGVLVSSVRDLREELARMEAGRAVRLVVRRGGELAEVTVRVGPV